MNNARHSKDAKATRKNSRDMRHAYRRLSKQQASKRRRSPDPNKNATL